MLAAAKHSLRSKIDERIDADVRTEIPSIGKRLTSVTHDGIVLPWPNLYPRAYDRSAASPLSKSNG